MRTFRCCILLLAVSIITACGGGGGGSGAALGAVTPGGGGSGAGTGSPRAGTGAQAALAIRLGRPARFLIGLGGGSSESTVQSQGVKPDIYDAYLVGVGPGAWQDWDAPAGAYVNVHAERAERLGAVPMFTLYQMAANGDGNLSGLSDAAFMTLYWDNVRLMYQRMAQYGKPVLITVEPDFWGYVQLQAPAGDPEALPAKVSINPDCADQPDNAVGIAGCIIQMARRIAPKALVGLSPSGWGGSDAKSVATYMKKLGAGRADFVAVQTLDRDAGCFEARGAECSRGGSGYYWDEASFKSHLADARAYFDDIELPLVWWQTPMGVPSDVPGGTPGHYRDNRESLFLTRTQELVDAGGVAAVFSAGAYSQTTLDTDGGQFKTLSTRYLESPVRLP